MNQLSRREQVMLVIAGVAIVVTLFYFGVPWLRQQIGGGEQAEQNRQELAAIQALLEFRPAVERMESYLRAQTGLQGERLLSEGLFERIKETAVVAPDPERPNAVNINKASRQALQALGLDVQQAMIIERHRIRHGRFDSLEELQEIRKGLFEGADEQAVIIERVAQIAESSGIERKALMQFDVHQARTSRAETLPASVRDELATQLYLYELEEEAERLRDALEQDKGEGTTSPTKPRAESHYPPLPEEIPVPWRLKLIEIIQKRQGDIGAIATEAEAESLQEAKAKAVRELKVSEDLLEFELLEKGRHGFLGIGEKPVRVRAVHQSSDEGLVTFFLKMAVEAEETELRDQLLRPLSQYVSHVAQTHYELTELLTNASNAFQRQAYIVEITFKGELPKLVQLIGKLERQHRWVRMRGLKISIADEKNTLLQANLTMVATVL